MISKIKVHGRGSGVYLLKFKKEIVYVGASKFVLARLAGHKHKIYDEMEIIWLPKKAAFAHEAILIKRHQPKYNLDFKLDTSNGVQFRLAKDNEKALTALVRDSKNDLLTIPKAANLAICKGLPALRKMFVSPK